MTSGDSSSVSAPAGASPANRRRATLAAVGEAATRGDGASASAHGDPFSRPLAELAKLVGADQIDGPEHLEIAGLNTLDHAGPADLTFIGSERHAARWIESKALAALVTQGVEVPGHDPTRRSLLRVRDADLAMAKLLALFAPPDLNAPTPGIAEDATIHPDADVDSTAVIRPGVRIGRGAVIGPRTVIEENVVIGPLVRIGTECVLRAGVVVRDRCEIGDRVSIHPNAVIGADGFGYRPDGRGGLIKIPHIGIVVIHDDVEVGACVTIDRAKFGRTEIGPHSKLDNLVQIGHNVRIGRGCALSAQVGIAGSVTVGDFVLMGGKAGVADHIRIGNQVKVAAYTGVMRDAEDGEILVGTPAMPSKLFWRLQAALFRFAGLPKSALSRRNGS